MACDYYMSMELLSLKIVDEHLANMSDTNTAPSDYIDFEGQQIEVIDQEQFIQNAANGFIVISSLCTYVEAAMNDIIGNCIGLDEYLKNTKDFDKDALYNKLRYGDVLKKAKYIYRHYSKVWKRPSLYSEYENICDIRNDLIHYKYNHISHGIILSTVSSTDYPTVPTDERSHILSDIFTRPYLQQARENMVALIKEIANGVSLDISEFCHIISASGCSFADNQYIVPCDELKQLRKPE